MCLFFFLSLSLSLFAAPNVFSAGENTLALTKEGVISELGTTQSAPLKCGETWDVISHVITKSSQQVAKCSQGYEEMSSFRKGSSLQSQILSFQSHIRCLGLIKQDYRMFFTATLPKAGVDCLSYVSGSVWILRHEVCRTPECTFGLLSFEVTPRPPAAWFLCIFFLLNKT